MSTEIYEIPSDIHGIYEDLNSNDGEFSYRIIDYNDGMSMDNIESLDFFLGCIKDITEYIIEDSGTQVVLKHPEYEKKIVIDSGGLGDFFSHGFDCYFED